MSSRLFKGTLFIVFLMPLVVLLFGLLNEQLGANPIEVLTRDTGQWALRFLLISLSISPLRLLFGWHFLAPIRRMVGLYCFFYASVHMLLYIWLDQFFNLGDIRKYEGQMSSPQTKVLKELKSINFNNDRIIINKGFFNAESLNKMKLPNTVSFAYLDFDFYQPTLDGLNYLNNVLSVGGIIIVDDYDFFSTGVKTSVDEWFKINSKSFNKKIMKTKSASFAILERVY